MPVTFSSTLTADLIQSTGDDQSVLDAMLISTGKNADELIAANPDKAAGRINFLMANRHGTPFEHNSMTFYVKAPIAVFREFHRHRIGWSYNEVSGRYKKLEGEFYIPPKERPLVQEGKPGAYTFVPGTDFQHEDTLACMRHGYEYSYARYEEMLADDVAKEVARMVLPVGIYTEMYATCNARSLMAFLSLRTTDPDSTFPSFPMWEIEQVARQMEDAFRDLFPMTWAAFDGNGRVCP